MAGSGSCDRTGAAAGNAATPPTYTSGSHACTGMTFGSSFAGRCGTQDQPADAGSPIPCRGFIVALVQGAIRCGWVQIVLRVPLAQATRVRPASRAISIASRVGADSATSTRIPARGSRPMAPASPSSWPVSFRRCRGLAARYLNGFVWLRTPGLATGRMRCCRRTSCSGHSFASTAIVHAR